MNLRINFPQLLDKLVNVEGKTAKIRSHTKKSTLQVKNQDN